jgi:hypothetical protein
MASTYSGNLAIELIGTGDQAGTWGNTTNTNLGTTLEQAIVGTANVTMTSATNTAITIAQNNTFQAARSVRLNLVGTISTTPYLFIPAITKPYFINNGLANTVIISNGSNAAATGTSVSVPANSRVIIYNDGTNVSEAINYISSLSNVTINGGTANALSLTNVTISSGNINGVTSNASTFSNATVNGGTANGVTSSNVTIISGTVGNTTVNAYTEGVIAVGNTGNAVTINIANATIVTATLTANCTWTMPGNTAGKSFTLILKTGNGSFTSTFTNVKWTANTAPTITTTASRADILTFVADGANWYGNYAQNYTP